MGQSQRVKQVLAGLFPVKIASVGSGDDQKIQARIDLCLVFGQHGPDIALETVSGHGRVADLFTDRDPDPEVAVLLPRQRVDHEGPVGD